MKNIVEALIVVNRLSGNTGYPTHSAFDASSNAPQVLMIFSRVHGVGTQGTGREGRGREGRLGEGGRSRVRDGGAGGVPCGRRGRRPPKKIINDEM